MPSVPESLEPEAQDSADAFVSYHGARLRPEHPGAEDLGWQPREHVLFAQ